MSCETPATRTRLFNDDDAFLQIYDPSVPRKAWIPRTRYPPNLCIPQLRLFAAELGFLTLALSRHSIEENCVVVYAGAATGNHIPVLASFYPNTPFHLYDPQRFAIQATDQMQIYNELFTTETARRWLDWCQEKKLQIIFISDIRTPGLTGEDYEDEISSNMETQALWMEILAPVIRAFSLKFRISYKLVEKGEKVPYFDGWLMMQPFTKPLSMELRLVGLNHHAMAGSKEVIYDSRQLEEILFHHNTVVRPNKNLFSNVYSLGDKKYGERGFDHGYDITYLLYVVDNYRRSPNAIATKWSLSEKDSIAYVNVLINRISGGKWAMKA